MDRQVGQKQGGFMGIMQRAMDRASSNVWFERSEAKDRNAVARRLVLNTSGLQNTEARKCDLKGMSALI